MEKLLVIVLYIIIFIAYVYYIRRYQKRNGFPGAYSGFMMGCVLYYIFIPIVLLLFEDFYLEQSGDWRYSQLLNFIFGEKVGLINILRTIVALIIGLLGLNFGYKLKRRQANDIDLCDSEEILDISFTNLIRRIGYVTFVFGGVAIILYVNAFGGIGSALQLSDILRQHYSSLSDYGISGVYSYFLILSGVLTVTPLLFYLTWKNSRRQVDLIMCWLSFGLSVLYLLINSGKSAFLRLGITVFYMILFEKKVKRKAIYFFVVIILGLPIMDILDALFVQQSIVDAVKNFNYLYLVREFAIPTELNYNMGDILNRYGYMHFRNLITDFLNILPGLQFESSFKNTSEYMRGANWIKLGGTPNDVLTYGYLQFKYLGVFVIWTLWGFLSGWLDNKIGKISNSRGKNLLAIIVCMNMFSVITCADISSTILYNLSFVLIGVVLWCYSKKVAKLK